MLMATIVEMEVLMDPSKNEHKTDESLKDSLTISDKHGFIEEYERQYGRLADENRSSNLYHFLQSLDDECFGRAVQFLKEENIFLIHELLCNMDSPDALRFLQNMPILSMDYREDNHQRTWLHVVARSDCDPYVIKFIIEDLEVSPNCQDDDGNTALHVFCANVAHGNFFCYIAGNYYAYNNNVEWIIALLSGQNGRVLMMKNKHDETPLEMVCQHKIMYDAVKTLLVDGNLLNDVNVLGNGFADIKMLKVPHSRLSSPLVFWIDVLRENNRSKLIAYMKDVEGFEGKYLIGEIHFRQLYRRYFTFGRPLCNEITQIIEELGKEKYKLSAFFGFPGVGDFNFYRSAPFLALITGRWNLVMPLVAFSRFDVVPFCLQTCNVCVRMQRWKNITGSLRQKIDDIHQSADAYLTEIINTIYQTYDGNSDYGIVCDYLNEYFGFANGSLMDVGYFANCKKFFNTFACQTVLSRLWKEKRGRMLNPFQKFVLHSVFHVLFILCLFSVLLKDRRIEFSGLEIFCYLYGIGYFVEEVRQMLYYHRLKQLTHYFCDATNVIDLFGLLFFLAAFVLRCLLSFSNDAVDQTERQNNTAFIAYLCLSLTSIFLSVRLLFFLSVFKTFGPKLKMIERMIIIDLIPVSVIFFVFILSFGVSFQSIIFTCFSNESMAIEGNSSSIAASVISLLADILWQPTFTIFEPKYIIDEASESKSPSIQHPMMKLFVRFLLLMFIIIVSVMLMNMLIALFSQTVGDISVTAEQLWAIGQWKLIREYMEKSLSVPPLNIIESVAVIIIKSFYRGRTSVVNEDKKRAHFHPFTILSLLKINRFELLKNIETSRQACSTTANDKLEDTLEMMNVLRDKMENLELSVEMLNRKTRGLPK